MKKEKKDDHRLVVGRRKEADGQYKKEKTIHYLTRKRETFDDGPILLFGHSVLPTSHSQQTACNLLFNLAKVTQCGRSLPHRFLHEK